MNYNQLTKSELEILTLIAKGLPNKEIAYKRNTLEYTVKGQVAAVFQKLSVVNRVQATIKALKLGIVKLEDL